MPGSVQRVGDANAAGGIILTGDPTVLVNGRPIATIGAKVGPHPPCPIPGTHCAALTTSKSVTVLVGGKPVCVTGDLDTCGHPRALGSIDVIIGG